jgi:preprotein translocase subunit SecG
MEHLVIVFHVVAALAITGLILIQQGKGADMGASFGGGASQTLFGSRGSGNALTRATAVLATLFFATSFALAVVAKNKATGADDFDLPMPAAIEVPAQATPAKPVDDIPTVDDNAAPAADLPAPEAGAAPAEQPAQ